MRVGLNALRHGHLAADRASVTAAWLQPLTSALSVSALQAYAAGDWQHAKIMLEECHDMRRDETGVVAEDAPSRVLLSYMAKFDYAAPSTWM